jgi:LEA14-like dessication related protein
MKTLKTSIVLVALATATFMSSCKQTQTVPLALHEQNELKFSGVSPKGVKGEVTVSIKNPNSFDVKVYRSDLDVKVNNIAVGKAKLKKHIVIPANSEIEETLYLKSNFSDVSYFDIPKVVKTAKTRNLAVSVKGNIECGRYMHKVMSPVNIKDTINIEEKAKPALVFISKASKKTVAFIKKKTTKEKQDL